MKPRIILSACKNIFKNLTCEEMFSSEALAPVLFLYQNDKTIVIGRNQNPWKEIHVDRVKEDQIDLCRRKSGGGAVYQDLGNVCFSFINPKSSTEFKTMNNSIVLRALSSLDVDAETSGRNDIVVEGKKVSGSAYKIDHRGNHMHTIHHGTMLIKTDFSALTKYLNPSKAKLESKGVKSVTSRVSNLTDLNPEITPDKFIKSMIKSFSKDYPDAELVHLEGLPPKAQKKSLEMQEWQWVYGESPEFKHNLETRFQWGIFDLNFDVIDGKISKIKIFSDCLYPDFVEFVESGLLNQKYEIESLKRLIDKCPEDCDKMLEDVIEWVNKNL